MEDIITKNIKVQHKYSDIFTKYSKFFFAGDARKVTGIANQVKNLKPYTYDKVFIMIDIDAEKFKLQNNLIPEWVKFITSDFAFSLGTMTQMFQKNSPFKKFFCKIFEKAQEIGLD